MTEKYRTLSIALRGKVLDVSPCVPRGDIAWLMGKTHIGTSDRDIVRDMWSRSKSWPLVYRKQGVRYALQIMDDMRRIAIDYRL